MSEVVGVGSEVPYGDRQGETKSEEMVRVKTSENVMTQYLNWCRVQEMSVNRGRKLLLKEL